MLFLIRFIVTFIAVLLIWHFLPGITIHNIYEAVLFAGILSIINAVVRPILVLLTLPITILTLGLFTLVINIFTFWLAVELSYGVHIDGFSPAFWGGLLVWITGFATNRYIWNRGIY